MNLRPATMLDVWALRPRMTRAEVALTGYQLHASAAFAVSGDDGRLLAVGGLYPEALRRVCWMLTARQPSPRELVAGVALVLEHAGEGPPIQAEIDADNARDIRFAEFLGFRALRELSSAPVAGFSLPARILLMELS